MEQGNAAEPWMRGTHGDLDPLRQGVVHALEQALEDTERKAGALTTEQVYARPSGIGSVAFHMRHMVRSLDRLLTYAEGRMLDTTQLDALATEHAEGQGVHELLAEFRSGIRRAMERVVAFSPGKYGEARGIGRKQLPTTVGGLLIHCAEHTQRHVGQLVTTARLVGTRSEGTA